MAKKLHLVSAKNDAVATAVHLAVSDSNGVITLSNRISITRSLTSAKLARREILEVPLQRGYPNKQKNRKTIKIRQIQRI